MLKILKFLSQLNLRLKHLTAWIWTSKEYLGFTMFKRKFLPSFPIWSFPLLCLLWLMSLSPSSCSGQTPGQSPCSCLAQMQILSANPAYSTPYPDFSSLSSLPPCASHYHLTRILSFCWFSSALLGVLKANPHPSQRSGQWSLQTRCGQGSPPKRDLPRKVARGPQGLRDLWARHLILDEDSLAHHVGFSKYCGWETSSYPFRFLAEEPSPHYKRFNKRKINIFNYSWTNVHMRAPQRYGTQRNDQSRELLDNKTINLWRLTRQRGSKWWRRNRACLHSLLRPKFHLQGWGCLCNKGTFHMEDLSPAFRGQRRLRVTFLHQPFLKYL